MALENYVDTSIVLSDEQIDLVQKAIDNNTTCPFENPEYELDTNTPCPVCGSLGTLMSDWYCVDDYRKD